MEKRKTSLQRSDKCSVEIAILLEESGGDVGTKANVYLLRKSAAAANETFTLESDFDF